jgi:amidase
MEAFNELRVEEQRLPLKYPNRDLGYRPTAQEDPLNLFIRKCRVAGASHGPLQGKTIGLKDHISVAGIPLSFGCHFMDGYIPDFDATIVTRLLDAGGIIVGKMNMEDFSFGGPGVGGVGDFGRPLNPHNPAHITGGSSSGSGAAVAAGYVDIAFGGDQGGSIRIPAAWSGAIGLMATHGLIPHTGVFSLDPSVDYVGPLTHTVEDMAVVLECVAGPDGYDPRQVNLPAQLPKYTEVLTRGVQGLKIGILTEGFGGKGSEPDVEQAVLEAIATLERAGVRVEKVSVPLHTQALLAIFPLYVEGLKRLFDTNLGGAFAKTYYPTSLITTFGRFKQSHGHELALNIKLYWLLGVYLDRLYHGRLYAKAHNVRPTFVKQYNEAFARVDILAMPTTPIKAPVYHEPQDYTEAIERTLFGGRLALDLGIVARNTCPFNFTGFPALSIPCGKSQGLPIGLMLVAPFFREDQLFRAAYAYQHAVDWASLFPKRAMATENL